MKILTVVLNRCDEKCSYWRMKQILDVDGWETIPRIQHCDHPKVMEPRPIVSAIPFPVWCPLVDVKN